MAIVIDAQGNLVDTEGRINFFNTGNEQVFPRQGLEPLYPNFGAPMVNNTFLRPDVSSSNLISLRPETGINTLRFVNRDINNIQPQLPANRLEGLNLDRFEGIGSLGVANEEDVEQVDSLTGEKKSSGLADLFRTLVGFAVPGASFFLNKGRDALGGIRSLNQRLQGSTFGRSRSMQEFLERKRNEKLGNVGPGGIGLSRSELVQKNFANRVRDLADAGDDDRGGGASRTQRDAGPGFSGSGTAAEMDSF
jgi:hypothetical protein